MTEGEFRIIHDQALLKTQQLRVEALEANALPRQSIRARLARFLLRLSDRLDPPELTTGATALPTVRPS